MHATERDDVILAALKRTGFVTYRELEGSLEASPATIRRDLSRLENDNRLRRVRGGAKAMGDPDDERHPLALTGTPFAQSLQRNLAQKRSIGQAAAALCSQGEGVIIDGGTTTFQMCEHLAGVGAQVLTNSLHIVNALLPQQGTQLLIPSGTIFREQNIVLAPSGEAYMPNFHASKLFLGAASVSAKGIFQTDAILISSQRRLLDSADEIILLVDSSKLSAPSGGIVCDLARIDRMIVDKGAREEDLEALRTAGLGEITLV